MQLKMEDISENETIYPKSNFEIIEFSPGLGSLKKLYRL